MSRRIAVLGGAPPGEGDTSDQAIARRIAAGEPFWLDLHRFDGADLALLREVVRLHPLALQDASTLGRRPKIEEYGDMTYIVAFGATTTPDRDRLVEVHVVYAERFVVSLHRDASAAIDALIGRGVARPDHLADGPALLYRLLDALTESFFPAMDEVNEELDRIETELADPPRDGLQDDIIRIGEMLDGYRDLLQGANDVYLSSVSNRLNVVTKQLTVIAGIFLPLAFITGFFGQNFDWMVDHVGGPGAFFGLGIGLQLVTIAALVLLFRRRGWL